MNRHRNVCWLLVAAAMFAFQTHASAANVWLSLNLEFNTMGDFNSGGTWTVVAKADERGIAGLNLELTNVNFDPSTGFLAPVIFYNLTDTAPQPDLFTYDAAGFDTYGVTEVGQTEVLSGQSNTQANRRFFDVGVIGGATQPGQNGTPAVAPGIASRQVPWGAYIDDPLLTELSGQPDLGSFTGGVTFATGSFDPGVIPGWGVAPELTAGNVWPSTTALAAIPATIHTTIRHVVPEPTTIGLGGVSALALLAVHRRRIR